MFTKEDFDALRPGDIVISPNTGERVVTAKSGTAVFYVEPLKHTKNQSTKGARYHRWWCNKNGWIVKSKSVDLDLKAIAKKVVESWDKGRIESKSNRATGYILLLKAVVEGEKY